MIAVETALRYAAGWLAIGLGLFIAGGVIEALRDTTIALERGAGPRGIARMATALYVIPFAVGAGIAVYGLVTVIQVVPW